MVYLDTSALAKRYLNETGSDEFEAYLTEQGSGQVCTLTVTEMRCLLARRRREGSIDDEIEARILAASEWKAARLVSELRDYAPRTLDALHLACARAVGAIGLATADQPMAADAEALGMEVVRF